MENDLIDVIDGTTELFGNQNESTGQLFNWADEFISDNDGEISGSVRGNLGPGGGQAGAVVPANYAVTASTPASMHTLVSHSLPHASISGPAEPQKHTVGVVTQALLNPLQNVGQGLATQILQQGNQQFVLKAAPGGQIQLNPATPTSQLQLQQILGSGLATAAGTQFHVPNSLSRTPNQSPAPSASHSRSLTPSSAGVSVSHASPSHPMIGGQFKSASPVPNVNFVHLPPSIQQQQLQLAPGTVLQIPGNTATQNIVCSGGGPTIVNPSLLQGQTTILGSQGQNIVNAQNTVIQNPNVVNVNVATHHVLCNTPQTVQSNQNPMQVQPQFQIQNQQKGLSLGNIQTATQNPFNIQGTLIQTAEGKNILIPSQNISQPINIQNLQQLTMPTSIGPIQGQLGSQSPQLAGQTLTGSAGNLIRLQQQQQPQQDSRSIQGLPQIVLNSQGQQVIIQRAGTPGSQQSNIVVRTVPQPNLVQVQQAGLQAGQGQQAGQPSLQSVTGVQSQQFKIVNQATSQGSSVPMINIGGQNVSLQQLSSQLGSNIQFVQQQPQVTSAHVISSQQGHVIASQQGHGCGALQGQVSSQIIGSGLNGLQSSQRRTTSSPGHATLQTGQGLNQMLINIENLENGQMSQPEKTMPKVVTIPQVMVARQSNLNKQQENVLKSSAITSKVNFIHVKQENVNANNVGATGKQMLYKNQLIVKQCETLQSSSVEIKQEPSALSIPSVVKQEPVVSTAMPSCVVKREPMMVNSPGQLNVFSTGQTNEPRIENLFASHNYLSTSSSFTTAQTTTTTTTVSQSATSMSQFNMPNIIRNVVSPVELNQASISSSNVSGAGSDVTNNAINKSTVPTGANQSHAKPGATLQTIHLPPDIQHKFQRIRLEIEKVNKQTDLSPQDRHKRLQQLNVCQRQILLKGRVLATTKAEPHHIQQGLQSLTKEGLITPPTNTVSATGTTATAQHDNNPPVSQHVPSFHQTVLQQNSPGPTSPQVQGDVVYSQSAQEPSLVVNARGQSQNFQGEMQPIHERFQNVLSTAQNVESFVQNSPANIASVVGVGSEKSVAFSRPYSPSRTHTMFDSIRYQHQPDSTTSIGQAKSSHLIDSAGGAPTESSLSGLLTSQTNPDGDVLSSYGSSTPAGDTSLTQSFTPHSNTKADVPEPGQGPTSITAGATPVVSLPSGETNVSSSPQVAVPTQIKIAHKVLTLSLTPAQKEKVQRSLDRLTPEQQQQYLQTQQGVLQRIQKQQQLKAQIRAQVEAQKRQQQQQQQGGSAADNQIHTNLASLITQKLQLQRSGLDGQHAGIDGQKVGVGSGGQRPQVSDGGGQLPLLQPKIEVSSPPSTYKQTPEFQGSPAVQIKPELVTIKHEVKTIPVPNLQVHTSTRTDSPLRGTKRNFMDIPKGTLINQQIKQDQNHSTNPDTKRPFKSRGDACRRLLRYHVFQGHGPSQQEFDKFDGVIDDAAQALLTKRDRMVERFRYLLMQESMRACSSSELVMLQRIQNQDLRKLIEDEKRLATDDPDAFMQTAAMKKEPGAESEGHDKTDDADTSGNTEDSDDVDLGHDSDKKVKKLVIKSDGMNFSSSFKRHSLDSMRSGSSGDSEEGEAGTPVNMSDDSSSLTHDGTGESVELVEEEVVTDFQIGADQAAGSQFTVVTGTCDLTNDDDSDTNEYNGDIAMQDETDNAALTISSADDSQDDTLISDGMDQSTHSTSLSFSQNLSETLSLSEKTCTLSNSNFQRQLSGNLTSQSNYFEQTNDQNGFEFFSMSHMSRNKTSDTYIPDHSPVSNDSIDNGNKNNSSTLTFTDAAFSSLHMYQPITESLTDSEENSYYSADNSAEQNLAAIDDGEPNRRRGKRRKWDESATVQVDSDSEPAEDSDPDVKAQMESAINSILSLSQGAPLSESFSVNQSNHQYTNSSSRTNSRTPSNASVLFTAHEDVMLTSTDNDSQSQCNTMSDSDVAILSPPVSVGNDNEHAIVIDEDLDAAVQSILM